MQNRPRDLVIRESSSTFKLRIEVMQDGAPDSRNNCFPLSCTVAAPSLPFQRVTTVWGTLGPLLGNSKPMRQEAVDAGNCPPAAGTEQLQELQMQALNHCVFSSFRTSSWENLVDHTSDMSLRAAEQEWSSDSLGITVFLKNVIFWSFYVLHHCRIPQRSLHRSVTFWAAAISKKEKLK